MTRKIHLIERLKNFEKIEGRIFDSGLWDVSPRTAESLVGGDIYFHEKQKNHPTLAVKFLDIEYTRVMINIMVASSSDLSILSNIRMFLPAVADGLMKRKSSKTNFYVPRVDMCDSAT